MESSENGKEFWERSGKRINTGVIQLSDDAKAVVLYQLLKKYLYPIGEEKKHDN